MVKLSVLVVLLFTACSTKVQKEVVYVDRPIEVKVPVKCKVPDVYCDFNRTTDTEVISALLECIIELKRSSEVCK